MIGIYRAIAQNIGCLKTVLGGPPFRVLVGDEGSRLTVTGSELPMHIQQLRQTVAQQRL